MKWIKNLNEIYTNSTFHGYLPDDDPAGSKRVANVYNKKILIESLVYLLRICYVDGCIIIQL
jgi:hypothetical protein